MVANRRAHIKWILVGKTAASTTMRPHTWQCFICFMYAQKMHIFLFIFYFFVDVRRAFCAFVVHRHRCSADCWGQRVQLCALCTPRDARQSVRFLVDLVVDSSNWWKKTKQKKGKIKLSSPSWPNLSIFNMTYTRIAESSKTTTTTTSTKRQHNAP